MMPAPLRNTAKPAFIVQKLPGTRQQKFIKFDGEGKKREIFTEVDAGYLVTIRRGDSFRVTSAEELHRLGFDDVIPMLDDEGETVGYMDNPIAEDKGEKK
jgi:hypothetical protein